MTWHTSGNAGAKQDADAEEASFIACYTVQSTSQQSRRAAKRREDGEGKGNGTWGVTG